MVYPGNKEDYTSIFFHNDKTVTDKFSVINNNINLFIQLAFCCDEENV